MANHKSAEKRIRSNAKRRDVNKISVSRLKTLVGKTLETETKTDAAVAYKEAVSHIDKMVAKGRIHRNTGARRKSALTKHVNSLSK